VGASKRVGAAPASGDAAAVPVAKTGASAVASADGLAM